MAHFAKIDSNNVVTEVIVSEKYFINSGLVGDEFLWIQTSYNSNFRKNFAVVGGTYDKTRDAFIPPKPYDSWVLNEDTCNWESPVSVPDDEDGSMHWIWDEDSTSWVQGGLYPEDNASFPNDGNDYFWNEENQAWDLVE